MAPISFIDFEASSLSQNSWPIEVGIATINDGQIESWGSLIRPAASWDLEDWDLAAELKTGINRHELYDAPAPRDVADELIQRAETSDFVLYSDAPAFDANWLRVLMDEHPSDQRVQALDFDTLINTRMSQDMKAWERVYNYLDSHPAPHRAEADARRLASAFLEGA
ncbi:hypothetical protein FGK63_20390 [Ruegeria sediminis]|uniref:Exonuclease domain-containing protein n=1 Tax=Ruegeria sediminis TaxID=2583820 RepID=A0ABY2WTE2_9RHOB|nr:exonuclease domain-containing protein [Ruegeria sediminis]TMV02589.1 hypothetical protein FGK63_20390 [Ruegeria sediminis]